MIAIETVRLFDEIQEKSRQLAGASQHKSQFLANMSHELRTPLNAILGYTELLIDKVYGETPEKMQDVLQRIQGNGRHLLGLINDVLDLSKIEAGQLILALGDYSLKNVVHTVVGAAEPLAEAKQVALKVEVPPDLPPGYGDERRLTQVVFNLVGNAIKFTDVGEVVVKAAKVNGSFEVSPRSRCGDSFSRVIVGWSTAPRGQVIEEVLGNSRRNWQPPARAGKDRMSRTNPGRNRVDHRTIICGDWTFLDEIIAPPDRGLVDCTSWPGHRGGLGQLPKKLAAGPRVLARTRSLRTQSGTKQGGPPHDHWAKLGQLRYTRRTRSQYAFVVIALFSMKFIAPPSRKKGIRRRHPASRHERRAITRQRRHGLHLLSHSQRTRTAHIEAHIIDLSPNQIIRGRSATSIRNVRDFYANDRIEQRAAKVRRSTGPS